MLSLIVNPSAGGGRAGRGLPHVEAALSGHGLDHHVELTRSLDHARELAVAAAAAGELPVAFGGDGLVGAVAGAAGGAGGTVGVLPGGRGNDFARMLGIPRDPAAACAVFRTGIARELDLGQVGERTFIGIASCGFDSDANRIANQTRVVSGRLVYIYGALRALVAWKPAKFTVRLDGGEPLSLTGYTVAAANSGAYGGGMLLAPDASLQDGLLEIVLCADVPKLRFLSLMPSLFKGTHVRHPAIQILRARKVEISASRPFALYADGDPIAELPVTVRALAGAVRVMVPAG